MRMVNVGFPERWRYGFEMVDARRASISPRRPASIENLHRIESIGFFSNFRRFNLNANTCDLSAAVSQGMIARTTATVADKPQREPKRRPGSRDVFSASHGVLARAGARGATQRQDA